MNISNTAIKFACVSGLVISDLVGLFDWRLQPVSSQQNISSFLLTQKQTTQTKPIGRSASGTTPRGDCPALLAGVTGLTALTPDKNEDTVTLSQSPTFHFYSPYPSAKYRLRLFAANKRDVLYRQDIQGPDKTGIFTVSLKNITALKPNERYFWELEYFCSDKPNASNPIVFGYLYRDQLTASQKQEFSRAKTYTQRIDFYRKNGIWVELLDEIAKSYPQSKTIWQQTLDAEGLQSISNQELLPTKRDIKP